MNERLHLRSRSSGELPFHATHPSSGILMRKCGCGSSSASGECEECKKKSATVQRRAAGPSETGSAPPIVNDVLNSPGQPLDAGAREFFEPRFGHDFSKVRVHVDMQAAESARSVNALAYAAGRNVVFGAGQYAPGSRAGRTLIAHELAHVIQQEFRDTDTSSDIEVGTVADSYEREADRVAASIDDSDPARIEKRHRAAIRLQRACSPREIGTRNECPRVQGDVTGEHYLFVVNCDTYRPGEEARLQAFAGLLTSGGYVTIHGFASEEGDPTFNENLGCARAIKAQQTIDSVLVTKGVHVGYTLLSHGATAGDREERRSVTIDWLPAGPQQVPPKEVCGPDVTKQVSDAVAKTRSTFGGWTKDDKTSACHALTSMVTGGYAWDIGELHNNAWILDYRPECATEKQNPPCGSSVRVGSDCYYAGSVNYVIFGVMCDLCEKHFTALGSDDANDFKLSGMLDLINKYKGTGFSGLGTPSKNFVPSKEWAIVGLYGWPGVAAPPGDRSNCVPLCQKPYAGSDFTVHWVPKGWF